VSCEGSVGCSAALSVASARSIQIRLIQRIC
jgi:hypothetical protein